MLYMPPESICFLPRKKPPSKVMHKMKRHETMFAMLVEGMAAPIAMVDVEAATLTSMTISMNVNRFVTPTASKKEIQFCKWTADL